MLDAIGNMPLHPLVVHAVVVGAPLAALLGFLFAVPRLTAWARWPLAVVSVGALAAGIVAKESGEGLQRTLGITPADDPIGPLIAKHSMLAGQLGTASNNDPLTERERECLFWVAEGKTTEEVGVILGVSTSTANSHLTNAIQKLGARNRALAIATAIRHGLI